MKQILLDFWAFIKDPKDEQYKGEDKIYKWKVFFQFIYLRIITINYLYTNNNIFR